MDATQLALFALHRGRYRRDVTDAPTPWIAYLDAAIDHAGGVSALARHAHVDPGTIHRWRRAGTASRATIENITAIADAYDGDRPRALRAAGVLTAADPGQPAPIPGLADRLRRINDQMDQIVRSSLPDHEKIRAVDALSEQASRVIAMYRQPADGQGDEGDGAATA
jgi:hypothetical protein